MSKRWSSQASVALHVIIIKRTVTTNSGTSRNVPGKTKEFPFKIGMQNASFQLPLLFSHGLDHHSKFSNKIAFIDHHGQGFSFRDLTKTSLYLKKELKTLLPTDSLEERIAFLCERNINVPTTLGAIWFAQHIAIPLTSSHPDHMLEYFLKSTSTNLIITDKTHADRLNRIANQISSSIQLLVLDHEFMKKEANFSENPETKSYEDLGAMILFTSGSTGKPKGVLLTHKNLKSQVENICGGWQVSEKDTMLHVLPLHHTHGLIHAMLSPMAAGATCQMLQKFDASETWQELLSPKKDRPNLFTAVPTVFVKLIEEYDKTFSKNPAQVSIVQKTCQEKMRLFLSGSASLPVPILEKFENLSGHRILERYGMTETGLILCSPLSMAGRKPGFVGTPLESVKIAVADITNSGVNILAEGNAEKFCTFEEDESNNVLGDLLVKGPSVFKEYWGNPEATKYEFTEDGWFKTGDTVEFKDGSFKILGRRSVDIIKSGGYKLSALEIETQLLSLKEVKEVAVLGLSDSMWGQKVAALIVWTEKELSVQELRDLAKERLPSYACPHVIQSLQELPRNHLGKVNKKELAKYFL